MNCGEFLRTGTCPNGEACTRGHTMRQCSCGQILSARAFDSHRNGKPHKKKMAERREAERRDNQSQRSQPNGAATTDTPPATTVSVKELKRHRREQHEAFVAFVEDATADKEGITVSALRGLDFGIVEQGKGPSTVVLKIQKANRDARVALAKFRLASSVGENQDVANFSVELLGQNRWINGTRRIHIHFQQSSVHEGLHEDTLEMLFHDVIRKKDFVIIRNISATVGSKLDQEALKPIAPYVPREKRRFAPPKEIVLATRPPSWSPPNYKHFLDSFDAPHDLIEAAYGQDGRPSMSTQEFRGKYMPTAFNVRTYEWAFRVPLFVEEEKMKQDLDQYSMTDVTLTPNHPRYNLEVKGLAEGRPSVLTGDFILVKHCGSTEDKWYQGRVHEVYANHVALHFGDGFSTYRGTKFDVRFVLNRIPHRRMHEAVRSVKSWHTRLLFPTPDNTNEMNKPTAAQIADIRPFNRLVGGNPEQMGVVSGILNLPPGSPPFIVFGPPGTGKTVTIIESIRQLLFRHPDAKILVCAPSNSAADLAASKLFSALSSELKMFSCYNQHNVFEIPDLEAISAYRVIVSTCVSGGVPFGLGVKKGHFQYIFIDEAGQAKEPECMVPILSLADKNTNVILAGDNKQLGPVLHSPLAGALGLKVSYLSRLMDRPLYNVDDNTNCPGKGLVIVKLIQHFRSHPAILRFPNSTFYNDELQPRGDVVITQSLERFEDLPKKGFPIIFHSVIGKDQREASSPSFFNIEEATVVKNYCMGLVGNRKNRVEPKDIGVITPYHTQRCKIGQLFSRSKITDIKVGSVEEFQGQERKVIIVSTVRSSDENVMADIRRNLGFVAEPRRFNVAITRARALLIVVGNPNILALDPLWRSFLNYVHTGGGWRGKQISWDPSESIRRAPDEYAGEMRRRAEGKQLEMVERLRSLITTMERAEGFLLDEDDLELGEAEDDFVPERGTFYREDE